MMSRKLPRFGTQVFSRAFSLRGDDIDNADMRCRIGDGCMICISTQLYKKSGNSEMATVLMMVMVAVVVRWYNEMMPMMATLLAAGMEICIRLLK